MRQKLLISVVMPCLNEVESIGECIKDAVNGVGDSLSLRTKRGKLLRGEIIVVDNGSTDGSAEIVRQSKSKNVEIRLVTEREKGYGAALARGFREARGEIVVMGDSDGSYDFREIPKLVSPIVSGNCDLVLGSRIKGRMEKGAMPWTHRLVGTPILTAMANVLFDLKLSDTQTGFRAILNSSYRTLGMRMRGMEFASEMLVRAKRQGLRLAEAPVAYRRRRGRSKLLPMADAWRHIRFLLLFSPGRMFTVPGVILFGLGLVFFGMTAFGPYAVGRAVLDIHTLSIAGMVMLMGFELMSLGMFARVYGKYSFGVVEDDFVDFFIERFELEQGIRVGSLLGLAGVGVIGVVGGRWVAAGFPALSEIRPIIVGTVLMLLGTQMIFGSFFLSFLRGEGK